MEERKIENLKVVSSSLTLDKMSRSFGIIYKYLQSQIFSPYLKSKLRVFIAKDIRSYQTEHHDVMQQFLGSCWPENIQYVKVENLVLKKVIKIILIIILIILIIYSII